VVIRTIWGYAHGLRYDTHSFCQSIGRAKTRYAARLPLHFVAIVLTAWIPDPGSGRVSTLHKHVAFSLAAAMIGLAACLPFARHTIISIRILGALAAIWYAYTFYVYFADKRMWRFFLVFQSINIVSFVTIFTLAYTL
jgi:hypothetical protein